MPAARLSHTPGRDKEHKGGGTTHLNNLACLVKMFASRESRVDINWARLAFREEHGRHDSGGMMADYTYGCDVIRE
jgi:hypothetical protein